MNAVGKSFFILQKPAALGRLANKIHTTIDDLIKDDEPPRDYYIYVRLKAVDIPAGPEVDRGRLRCIFDELNVDNDRPSGRRGVLHVFCQELIDVIKSTTLPTNAFLVNCGILERSSTDRINLFNIELEIGSENSEGGAIYKIVTPEPSMEQRLPLTVDVVSLKELFEAPMLNVYGVIKKVDVSESEAKIKLTLTDPSIGYRNHIACYLTSDLQARSLPLRANVGDIVRLHRITARKQHGDYMQLFGRMGKAGLSWLLFDGRPGSDLTPESSSANFSIGDHDYETVVLLRRWFKTEERKPAPGNQAHPENNEVIRLGNFQLKTYGNLLLQVVGVFESTRSSRPIIVRGWDGTKCTRDSVRVDPEKEGLPIFSYDKNLCVALRDYVVDVFIYDEHRTAARELRNGQYVLMTNVHFGFVTPPYFTFFVHGGDGGEYGRRIDQINGDDPVVDELKQTLDQCFSKLPLDVRLTLASDTQREKEVSATDHIGQSSSESSSLDVIDATEASSSLNPSASTSQNGADELPRSPRRTKSATASTIPAPIRTASLTDAANEGSSSSANGSFWRSDLMSQLKRRPLAVGLELSTAASPNSLAEQHDRTSESSIYSQPPVRLGRTKITRPMISVQVETCDVVVTSSSPPRHVENASDESNASVDNAAGASNIFGEHISGLSSSPSTQEIDSSSSDDDQLDYSRDRCGTANVDLGASSDSEPDTQSEERRAAKRRRR